MSLKKKKRGLGNTLGRQSKMKDDKGKNQGFRHFNI